MTKKPVQASLLSLVRRKVDAVKFILKEIVRISICSKHVFHSKKIVYNPISKWNLVLAPLSL